MANIKFYRSVGPSLTTYSGRPVTNCELDKHIRCACRYIANTRTGDPMVSLRKRHVGVSPSSSDIALLEREGFHIDPAKVISEHLQSLHSNEEEIIVVFGKKP